MFKVEVTINLPDDKEIDTEYTNESLDHIWGQIKTDFPQVTSIVMVFLPSTMP